MQRKQQLVVLALVRPLMKVMVLNVFTDRVPERVFAEEDHPVDALVIAG
jgi:hypothetical protein